MNQSFAELVEKAKYTTRMNQGELAIALGISPQYMSDLIKGRKPNSEEKYAIKLAELCGQECENESLPNNGNPYFNNFSMQGGSGHGTGMEQAIAPDGYMSVPGVPTKQNIMFFKVRGNSMLNKKDPSMSIPHGAWVALKKAQSQNLRWGEVYAFETVDGPIIKKVEQSDKEDCIRCVSFNEEDTQPFDVAYSDIVEGSFHRVLGIVNVNMWSY